MISYENWKIKASAIGLFTEEEVAYRYYMSVQTKRYNLAMTILVNEMKGRNDYLTTISKLAGSENLKVYSDSTGLSPEYISNVETDPVIDIYDTCIIRMSQLFFNNGYNLDMKMVNRCLIEITSRVLSLDFKDKQNFIEEAEKRVAGVDLSTVGKLVEAFIFQQFLKHAVNGMDDIEEKPFKSRITKLLNVVEDYKPRVVATKAMLLNQQRMVSYSDLKDVSDKDGFTAVVTDIRYLLKYTELADVIEVV